MGIQFDIQQLPVERDTASIGVYTEGRVELSSGAEILGPLEYVLLVELAIAFDRWLRSAESQPEDFSYASMNFEEEAVLAFSRDAISGGYRAHLTFPWVRPAA